jgi:hypothetical protein
MRRRPSFITISLDHPKKPGSTVLGSRSLVVPPIALASVRVDSHHAAKKRARERALVFRWARR